MKVFLDTNILMDVLANREPFVKDSQLLLSFCEHGLLEGCVSTLSFSTLEYVLRKLIGYQKAREKLRILRTIVTPVDTTSKILDRALNTSTADFEDALQFYAACSCGAEYILTRNVADFTATGIPAVTPTEFLTTVPRERLRKERRRAVHFTP